MGSLKEFQHTRENTKAKDTARKIISRCAENGFTISDMKDLAVILPEYINEAVISEENNTVFTVPRND